MTAAQKKIIKRLLAGERLIPPGRFGHQWHWNGGKYDGPDYTKPCIQGATINRMKEEGWLANSLIPGQNRAALAPTAKAIEFLKSKGQL